MDASLLNHLNRWSTKWVWQCYLPDLIDFAKVQAEKFSSYDTGSIGAVTTMPHFELTFGTPTPAMRGFIVSFLMLMGAVPAFFAGQLANRYGQLSVVMMGSTVFTLGAILQGAASALPMLLVGRALAGLGEGIWLSNVSV